MFNLKLVSFCCLALIGSTVHATAQVSQIPNSGCQGSDTIVTRGEPRIGDTLTFRFECGQDEIPMLFFGEILRPPMRLQGSAICNRGGCTLAVSPDVILTGRANTALSVPVPIPRDRSLIGVEVGVQGACIDRDDMCLTLSRALRVRIQEPAR